MEDRETGQGMALMSSLQVGYSQGLVQSRLLDVGHHGLSLTYWS